MAAILPPNDERIRKFLRQAGVDENSPVDPVSRDALLELLHETQETTPVARVAIQRDYLSDISEPFSKNSPPAGESCSQQILQLMQQQTQMILDLHKRMDHLTALVQKQQQQQQQQPTNTRQDLNRQIDELFEKVKLYQQNPDESSPATTPERSFGQLFYQLVLLFLTLRRRLAPNLNVGLIVKVVFILSILLTRFSRKQDNEIWHLYRLYLIVVFVLGGFLYQTGLFKVIYIFYVQEQYLHRILWKGEVFEDIEQEVNEAHERYLQRVRRVQPPRQPPRQRNNDDDDNDAETNETPEENAVRQEQHPGWRDTFIGGAIQPNNEPDRGVQFLRDVGFFIGSFFLSIFPMWRPEALAAAAAPPVHDDADDNGNGLPEVTAPADVLEAVEDEQEEDENNEEAKTD